MGGMLLVSSLMWVSSNPASGQQSKASVKQGAKQGATNSNFDDPCVGLTKAASFHHHHHHSFIHFIILFIIIIIFITINGGDGHHLLHPPPATTLCRRVRLVVVSTIMHQCCRLGLRALVWPPRQHSSLISITARAAGLMRSERPL